MLIEPKGNHTQPGVSNYDYRSVGWGSVTEMIELSADMPHYCFDCTVYLAVYGYRRCAYTIQASSSGLVSVQAGQAMGGHVSAEKFAYYSVHNANQFGNMKFTLTMVSATYLLFMLFFVSNQFAFVFACGILDIGRCRLVHYGAQAQHAPESAHEHQLYVAQSVRR